MHHKLPLLMEVAIEPKTPAEGDKLAAALERLIAGVPHLDTRIDAESGQTILQGTGEDALNNVLAKLGESDIDFQVGAPQVAYRQTIIRPITIEYTHKFIGPRSEFAKVRILYEPLSDGCAMQNVPAIMFENAEKGPLPPEFAAAVEKGIRAEAASGLRLGYPVTDFGATLVQAAYHEIDSSPRTFDIAARTTFRELANQNAVQITEPFMKVEVATPEDFLGGVIGDLNSRRGTVVGTTSGQLYHLVTAVVPFANMFGYQDTLNSMTQGRAHYEMKFDHYERAPNPDGDDPTFPGAIGMRVA